jgi:hypothetical protein
LVVAAVLLLLRQAERALLGIDLIVLTAHIATASLDADTLPQGHRQRCRACRDCCRAGARVDGWRVE